MQKRRGGTRKYLGVLALPLIVGCATIMQGTSQGVAISTSPSGASVYIDGNLRGVTPMVADLSRKDNHSVALRLDGYAPYELAMSRSVSGWVVGNIVFGGLIGLAVDAISGGLYKLTPDQITGSLDPGAAWLEGTTDAIVIAVVMQAEPHWQKVGQLERGN